MLVRTPHIRMRPNVRATFPLSNQSCTYKRRWRPIDAYLLHATSLALVHGAKAEAHEREGDADDRETWHDLVRHFAIPFFRRTGKTRKPPEATRNLRTTANAKCGGCCMKVVTRE